MRFFPRDITMFAYRLINLTKKCAYFSFNIFYIGEEKFTILELGRTLDKNFLEILFDHVNLNFFVFPTPLSKNQ